MTLVDGPFRSLEGAWHFHALRPGACKVQLRLHYEFANGLLGRAVMPVFDIIANSMIDSFADRAETDLRADRVNVLVVYATPVQRHLLAVRPGRRRDRG